MKEIREGNIFIYKLCICIKSRTHYTPKKKLTHWHTRTGMSLYRNTRHTTAVMNDLVRGVKRVTFTQEGFDASGAQRLSCGRFRSVWKRKRKLFSGDEQALCVAAGLCTRNGVCLVAVLCAIRSEEEEGKTRKGKWSKKEEQKSVPYLCVHNGFWKGKVGWRCSKGRKLTYDMHKKRPRKSNSARRET